MDLWKTIKSWKKSERKFKVLLKDPELEPNCLQRRQFCTNFTVEALVPRLAVAVVATNSIFAKSSMCTRQWLTCVAICRTKKAISGVLMRCILYQRFLNLSNWRHRTNALPTYVAQNSFCKNKIKTENKILFFLKTLKIWSIWLTWVNKLHQAKCAPKTALSCFYISVAALGQ